MFGSFFVIILGLCCCCKESSQFDLGRPQLHGPSEALVKSVVEFQCIVLNYPVNEEIHVQLFKEGNRSKVYAEYTYLDDEEGSMPLLVKKNYEGYLQCVASAQNNSNINATISEKHYLKVIEPVKNATIIYSGPEELFEGEVLELHCKLSAGNHVSYKWLFNGQHIFPSPSHRVADSQLTISRTTSKDSGSYECVATNVFNQTVFTASSNELLITVKDLVSTPDISFTVLKEGSQNYSAMVTCQTAQGAPPITFSLYNGSKLVANMSVEERHAKFKLPLVLDQHLGFFQCQVKNGEPTLHSPSLPLHVVPVGGPVTMHYEYNSGENYDITGLKFFCKAAKGSYPQYKWFLNETLLEDRGSFYYVVNDPPKQSMLQLSVGRSSAGTYYCKVSDSFDNATAISSKKRYLDKEVLNRLPDFVVAVVFGCFTFLIMLVSGCCYFGVIFRWRQYGEKSLWSLGMERNKPAFEGELDLSAYNEDLELLKTAREDEFDQVSEASVDEWPQIQKCRAQGDFEG